MIEHIQASIELSLRQGDTFFNNNEIIRALVYYYNGFKESTKLLPYIQTYNSVIMVKDKQEYKDEYNLLFKEKIQNIVDNISLEKQQHNINDLDLGVKATFKGRGIDNFPIKFSSQYNYYVERISCNKGGSCNVNVTPKIFLKYRQFDKILIIAKVDLQTLEKHFNYSLKKNLFGRLELLKVSFKIKKQKHVVKQNVVKEVVKENKQIRELTPWEECCANDIGPIRRSGTARNYGHINFGIRFGNRGNINIHRGW
jgi:hypothetical protein